MKLDIDNSDDNKGTLFPAAEVDAVGLDDAMQAAKEHIVSEKER